MSEHSSIGSIEDEIVDEFDLFEDWTDKYRYIIDSGRKVSPLAQEYYTEDNKVKGCQSNVWLHAYMQDGRLFFEADSDAAIVKGLVGLLLRVFSGQTPDDVFNTQLKFMERIGMHAHLSPNRSNGLRAMIKQMKIYALAYKAKSK